VIWKIGDRCKLARPRQWRYFGKTGVVIDLFEGRTMYGVQRDGSMGSAWVDCRVKWDDADWSYQARDQLEPLTKPKPPLVKWEDMPCNPDGSYKELVEILA
jgi:hypothetical protein